MSDLHDGTISESVRFFQELDVRFDEEQRELFLRMLKPSIAQTEFFVKKAQDIIKAYLIARNLKILDVKDHGKNYENISATARRLKILLERDEVLLLMLRLLAMDEASDGLIDYLDFLIVHAEAVLKDKAAFARSRLYISGRTDPLARSLWRPFIAMWSKCGHGLTVTDETSPLFEYIATVHHLCEIPEPKVESLRSAVRSIRAEVGTG